MSKYFTTHTVTDMKIYNTSSLTECTVQTILLLYSYSLFSLRLPLSLNQLYYLLSFFLIFISSSVNLSLDSCHHSLGPI